MKFVKCVVLMLLVSPVLPAFAQEFPSRPITLVVPFSAGGPGDVIARLLGTSMSATLKQALVIENVVGAGGTIGTNRVAKAAPDRHASVAGCNRQARLWRWRYPWHQSRRQSLA